MAGGYATRVMMPGEVAMAVDWAADEGWNPGLHDAATFRSADPSGFFIGLLDDEPVAAVSVVKYGAGFAFLGLYLVRPGFRGQGFGWRLWQDAMASAAGRLVGLDGVPAQQDNYRRSGFDLAWRNVRQAGRGLPQQPRDPRVVLLATLPFDAVRAHDQPFFPADRSGFLQAWIAQPDAQALGFVEGGRLRGYGVIRRCRQGWKIGPLVADGDEVVDALFRGLAEAAGEGTAVFLDTPEPNAAAMALARRYGMQAVFETARMYTGAAPAVPMGRLYGVMSFELG